MDMRLIPLKKVFDKFPRLVRDLAREQDKRVSFKVEGADIELDRTILDEISDPLMHVLRNAVDHGIEAPDVREANGKSRTGTSRSGPPASATTLSSKSKTTGPGLTSTASERRPSRTASDSPEELDRWTTPRCTTSCSIPASRPPTK